MTRQTGGVADAETSTKSRPESSALSCASDVGMMPSCSPSASTTLTSGHRICSFTRALTSRCPRTFCLLPLILLPPHPIKLFGTVQSPVNDVHEKIYWGFFPSSTSLKTMSANSRTVIGSRFLPLRRRTVTVFDSISLSPTISI